MAMQRLRLVMALLFVINLISALSVVFVTHSTRERFNALQLASAEHDELMVQWERLLLEHSTLADHVQLLQRAKKLGMREPKPINVMVLR